MRILLLASLLVMLLFTFALAHEGALSLYTDQTPSACRADLLTPYAMADVSLLYIKGDGPDLGSAFEFILFRERTELIVNAFNWSSAITLTMCGDPFTLCAGTASACLGGQGEQVVWLGTFTFLWFDMSPPPQPPGDPDGFYIQIRENPDADPDPGIIITRCETGNPPYLVKGGTFVFNGNCDPGVETKSWSAIKELYKQ